MYQLEHVHSAILRLLTLVLSGTYLSNGSKVSYPFFRRIHNSLEEEILNLKALMCEICSIESGASLYEVLAGSAKWLHSRIDSEVGNPDKVTVAIARRYNKNSYRSSKFDPVKSLCEYVRNKLEPYLVGAYIHGSLSTMDCTAYSDLDTLFIIKQKALEDTEKIKKMENLFIKSTRFLYQFDPLQHHGHFFLMESDLQCYNQSFLPLSAIKLSTCILDKGHKLTFCLRDSQKDSEKRFLDSVALVRRYIEKDKSRLKIPYYLKGFLSHFMILPALFLQMERQYVTKKDSFAIMRERVPSEIWQCMERVSEIRQNWTQETSGFRRRFMKIIGIWNPLLYPSLSLYFHECRHINNEIHNTHLLGEMFDFSNYLLKLSKLHENRQS